MEHISETKRVDDSRITLSALMEPQDTNGLGNVHGGVIMKMVDEAGALAAMRHARSPVVTVAVDTMTFVEPIRVGDVVQCSAALTYVGRTSMEVRVTVKAENPITGKSSITNTAYLVYVALDSNGRPQPVPRLEFVSDEEHERALQAKERQEFRKHQTAQSGIEALMTQPDADHAVNTAEDKLTALDSHPRSSALLQLLNQTGSQRILQVDAPDLGLAERLPYPFMAVVGQMEMRIALLLSVINPNIGGTLLIGPRGTGKTTVVRSLSSILPDVEVSDCEEGVFAEDLQSEEAQYLYPDCYEKHQAGQSISHYEPVKLIELPLNARLEDVVGGINERVAVQRNLVRLEKGILARADRHILYIDEVNLLDDRITDAILDAAAQGSYTVRRGAMVGTYRSRFILIGSMNPEEGKLRPQILDRFGLRVHVRGLATPEERLEVYRRAQAYRHNPTSFIDQWALSTEETLVEVTEARERLKQTTLDESALRLGLALIQALEIDSHRADYALFEAARAYAAADGRQQAVIDDVRAVAPMALRQRRSEFMSHYLEQQHIEDQQIREALDRFTS